MGKNYKPARGELVTCRVAEPAYYSEYAGNPKQEFTPGMVGVVATEAVPAVRGKRPYFYCIDFTGDNGKTWRVGLFPDNIVPIYTGKKKSR